MVPISGAEPRPSRTPGRATCDSRVDASIIWRITPSRQRVTDHAASSFDARPTGADADRFVCRRGPTARNQIDRPGSRPGGTPHTWTHREELHRIDFVRPLPRQRTDGPGPPRRRRAKDSRAQPESSTSVRLGLHPSRPEGPPATAGLGRGPRGPPRFPPVSRSPAASRRRRTPRPRLSATAGSTSCTASGVGSRRGPRRA